MRNDTIQILLIKPRTETCTNSKRIACLESKIWTSELSTSNKKFIESNLSKMKNGDYIKKHDILAWIQK